MRSNRAALVFSSSEFTDACKKYSAACRKLVLACLDEASSIFKDSRQMVRRMAGPKSAKSPTDKDEEGMESRTHVIQDSAEIMKLIAMHNARNPSPTLDYARDMTKLLSASQLAKLLSAKFTCAYFIRQREGRVHRGTGHTVRTVPAGSGASARTRDGLTFQRQTKQSGIPRSGARLWGIPTVRHLRPLSRKRPSQQLAWSEDLETTPKATFRHCKEVVDLVRLAEHLNSVWLLLSSNRKKKHVMSAARCS